jgi:hypothetical protein
VYSLPLELLAYIGDIGQTAAQRIHAYCRDKILEPLRFLLSDSDGATGSDTDVPSVKGGLDEEDRRRRILRWAKVVRTCEKGKKKAEVVATNVETDEEDDVVDVATASFASCEV